MYASGKLSLVASVLCVSLGVEGCAGLAGNSLNVEKPEETVAIRAAARWDALLKRDLAQAYMYLSPGARAVETKEKYIARVSRRSWNTAKVNSVECEREKCNVQISIEYSYKAIPSIVTVVDETWLLQDGVWWFVPRK